MIDYTVLPTVNATLNAISGIFLLTGYVLIKRRQINAHRNAMLGAFTTSTLFLICYLVYHAQAGSRPFTGQGIIRYVYFAILISHIGTGRGDPANGHLDALARIARAIRRTQAHRNKDISGMDVRVRDWRDRLPDALSDVGPGCGTQHRSCAAAG